LAGQTPAVTKKAEASQLAPALSRPSLSGYSCGQDRGHQCQRILNLTRDSEPDIKWLDGCGFRNGEVADAATHYYERGVFPKRQIAD
jgi:hypothetical protein